MADSAGYEFGTAAGHAAVLALIVIVGFVGYIMPVMYFVNRTAVSHEWGLRLLTGVLAAIPGLGVGAMLLTHAAGGWKPVPFQSLAPMARGLKSFPGTHLIGDFTELMAAGPVEKLFDAARAAGAISDGVQWAATVDGLTAAGKAVFSLPTAPAPALSPEAAPRAEAAPSPPAPATAAPPPAPPVE